MTMGEAIDRGRVVIRGVNQYREFVAVSDPAAVRFTAYDGDVGWDVGKTLALGRYTGDLRRTRRTR